MINEGKQLLFLSNFDGSWEHYLGEFIDQAAHGLTAVWSNAVNFPRAWNLVQGGATDEQRFKDYARGMQYYTQLWYSAYPFLSVVNVLNNAAIRSGLWECNGGASAGCVVEEVLKMLETSDIQGLILSGYGSQRFAEYLFLSIRDGVDAKAWLAELTRPDYRSGELRSPTQDLHQHRFHLQGICAPRTVDGNPDDLSIGVCRRHVGPVALADAGR